MPLENNGVSVSALKEAIETSWRPDTAYGGVERVGNPALGQCYATARVVQHFFPELDVARGEVCTGSTIETHYWNVRSADDGWEHLDLSWSQFPAGSTMTRFEVLDRSVYNDSAATVLRCKLLLNRVPISGRLLSAPS